MMTELSFEHKKVIIFDLDGTIIDLAVDWAYLKNILSQRYVKIYEGAACEFESISACLDFIVGKEDESELKNFFKIIREYELEGVSKSTPIQETIYFINHKEEFGIRKETNFAVLSLNTRKCIEESLKFSKISDKIDYIVGREDVRSWKPNPEGLLKIQEHYRVKKEEMVYIGDLPKDVETGMNAGIDAHLVSELIKMMKQKNG